MTDWRLPPRRVNAGKSMVQGASSMYVLPSRRNDLRGFGRFFSRSKVARTVASSNDADQAMRNVASLIPRIMYLSKISREVQEDHA